MHVLQIITYAAVENGMENKGKFWQHHDTGTGAAAVGRKANLGMQRCHIVQKSS